VVKEVLEWSASDDGSTSEDDSSTPVKLFEGRPKYLDCANIIVRARLKNLQLSARKWAEVKPTKPSPVDLPATPRIPVNSKLSPRLPTLRRVGMTPWD
jgi:hypothetical protein